MNSCVVEGSNDRRCDKHKATMKSVSEAKCYLCSKHVTKKSRRRIVR